MYGDVFSGKLMVCFHVIWLARDLHGIRIDAVDSSSKRFGSKQ
jgi:hypothetical protein